MLNTLTQERAQRLVGCHCDFINDPALSAEANAKPFAFDYAWTTGLAPLRSRHAAATKADPLELECDRIFD